MTTAKHETPKSAGTPKSPEAAPTPKSAAAASPQTAAVPHESGKRTSKKSNDRNGKRVLSVAIPDKLARQLKLLCSVEGVPASSIVIAAVQRAVNKRLGAALDAIRPDLES